MRRLRDVQAIIPASYYEVDVPATRVEDMIKNYNIDLDPDYQRGYVWSEEQQEKYVGSLLMHSRLPHPIIINSCGRDFAHSEIIDGKQRISALVRWGRGEIAARCPTGDAFFINDLDEVDQRCAGIGTFVHMKAVKLNRKQVLEYYLALNSGGTVHSHEEINRVFSLYIKECKNVKK